MLLIQYLQFVVLFQGGGSLILLFLTFLYSFVIYIAAYSAYLFFGKFFMYNIHSLGGATRNCSPTMMSRNSL